MVLPIICFGYVAVSRTRKDIVMQTLNAKRWLPPIAVKLLAALVICLATSALALASGDGKTRQRAREALRNGDYEAAEKQFREALAKDAHDNEARLGLSFALLKQRQLQGAYDHAARVILADPLSSRAHALLGSTILASGDFRNSVEYWPSPIGICVGRYPYFASIGERISGFSIIVINSHVKSLFFEA